ncbi:hypothetical protein BU087_12345, partial [Staphylococcus warneri]
VFRRGVSGCDAVSQRICRIGRVVRFHDFLSRHGDVPSVESVSVESPPHHVRLGHAVFRCASRAAGGGDAVGVAGFDDGGCRRVDCAGGSNHQATRLFVAMGASLGAVESIAAETVAAPEGQGMQWHGPRRGRCRGKP